LFIYSKKYNYNFYIDNSHEIFNHLLSNNKHIKHNILDKIYEFLPPQSYEEINTEINKLFLKNDSFCIMTNAFYTTNNMAIMENFGEIPFDCKIYLKQLFTPNKITQNKLKYVYDNLNIDLNKKYNIIHLRCGDIFIHDNIYDHNLFNFLNDKIKLILKYNTETQFILVSDSSAIAIELKKQNPNLFYWDNKKIHIGGLINNDIQNAVSDTLIDFFIMSNSDKIFYYTSGGISGFSKFASLIYDKEYINILDLGYIKNKFDDVPIDIVINNKLLDNFQMKNSEYLVYRDYYYNPSGTHEYRLYSYLSTFFNNTIILDIGTSHGRSAIALSHNETNKVLSYDICDHIQNNNHKIYSKQNVEFRIKNVLDDLTPELVSQCKIIMIDIDHYETIEQQIIAKLNVCGFSGIILLDDIHHPQADMYEAMQRLWNGINLPKFDITKYAHCSGTGLVLMNAVNINLFFN